MPAAEVDDWLRSNGYLRVETLELRPKPHPLLPDTPLSVSRGQAEAFYMVTPDDGAWIIKKFHPGLAPDTAYLAAVRDLLPPVPAFIAGKDRRLVVATDVDGAYHPVALERWLDGTILMAQVKGFDWATAADRLREGDITLPLESRARICRELAEAVAELEASGCSHRDLSSGNVYVNQQTWTIALIDWDSIYHLSLTMPPNTTCGTPGYIAPFVWTGAHVDPAATWHPQGDRFALALLCTEFFALEENSPMTGDGGMFNQEELRSRHGATIDSARRSLSKIAPDVGPLFERALTAQTYDECPAPEEWLQAANLLLGITPVPVQPISTDWFDEDGFLIGQVERTVAPPVIVLPEAWGGGDAAIGAASPPFLKPIVSPESWASNSQPSSNLVLNASRLVPPEEWGKDALPSSSQLPAVKIPPFEAWVSNVQPSRLAVGGSSTNDDESTGKDKQT